MDTSETALDMSFPECFSHIALRHSIYSRHTCANSAALLAYDWREMVDGEINIILYAQGYSDGYVTGWVKEEWPHSFRLTIDDFEVPVFQIEFPARIRPTQFMLPTLTKEVLDDIGPITDYLLTYDGGTEQFGLRVREITPRMRDTWFMEKLKRGA